MKIVSNNGKNTLVISCKDMSLVKESSSVAQAMITKNNNGMKFYNVFGNTLDIKDKLKAMKFRWFERMWSKPVEFISAEDKRNLQNLGLDVSIIDEAINETKAQEAKAQELKVEDKKEEDKSTDASQVSQVEEQKQQSLVDKELDKMKDGVKQAIAEGSGGVGKIKSLLNFIEDSIDKVADMTDEAAKSEFVKNFMSFMSKFHNYSFSNQMLIWIQKPNADRVAGAAAWRKMGRQVKNYDNAIFIIGRFGYKGQSEKTKEDIKNRGYQTAEEDQEHVEALHDKVYFSPVKVYDVSDTEVIEGWEKATGKKAYNPGGWRIDPNDTVEEVSGLVNSAKEWAAELGIDVGTEGMSDAQGGYSSGGKIRINDKYQGVNLFSTFIHECAHEIIHWREKDDMNKSNRQSKEIDAEATAYVVLQHYGFETKDTPNYLALWRAKGDDVRERRNVISKAANEIISGINKKLMEFSSKNVYEEEQSQEANAQKSQVPATSTAKSSREIVVANGKKRLIIGKL